MNNNKFQYFTHILGQIKNICVQSNQILPKFTGETKNFFQMIGKNI